MITARKGKLKWEDLPRRRPIATPRPWTPEEMAVACVATAVVAFLGFLTVLGGVTFWHRLAG
jgi:hypothetical protein